jgi:hypothetical protein
MPDQAGRPLGERVLQPDGDSDRAFAASGAGQAGDDRQKRVSLTWLERAGSGAAWTVLKSLHLEAGRQVKFANFLAGITFKNPPR